MKFKPMGTYRHYLMRDVVFYVTGVNGEEVCGWWVNIALVKPKMIIQDTVYVKNQDNWETVNNTEELQSFMKENNFPVGFHNR